MTNQQLLRLSAALLVFFSSLLALDSSAQTTRATQSGTVAGTMPQSLQVPAGLSFTVRLKEAVNSRSVTPGTMWNGVLADDFVSPRGRVYAFAGTTVTGVVASVQPSVNDQPAAISLRVTSIDGVELHTDNRIRSGPPLYEGRSLQTGSNTLRNDHPGTIGPGGSPGSGVNQQVNLSAGSLLTFSTSAP